MKLVITIEAEQNSTEAEMMSRLSDFGKKALAEVFKLDIMDNLLIISAKPINANSVEVSAKVEVI